jgi:putative exosortase-associated protein (TIGR04073 family)
MKKTFWILLLLLTLTLPAYAEEIKEYHWDDKLVRGLLNIVSSPVEIARSIQITSEETSLLEGWTIGLGKGLGWGVLRLGAGVLDTLTCPFDFPDENKGPLVQPEFVWEKPGVKYVS